ncbi:MAG TPA: malate synthase A, partial [Candidatus Eisenbacteria bacterium]|nr:malate synthase A [Candidatus Eisenbacteria bacterium]
METRSATQRVALAVDAPPKPRFEQILSAESLGFLEELARRFAPAIREALDRRGQRLQRLARGESLDFLPETASIRAGDWRVAPLPHDLERRIVEITGPTDRKMVINALNSGADVFMADFEDANSPTWENLIEGQLNLRDAVRRRLTHDDPATGKQYRLNEKTAVLVVRPRGLHLPERHVTLAGRPIPGSLLDFGLYVFHNAHELLARGTGPYFYLPKLESHREARIWNDVFLFAEDALRLEPGTIKATVLIETLPAAFEMEEILYELKQHSAGLNCGRWDYIFSFIKTRQHDPAAVLPDRSQVTMEQPCMRAYTQLAVRTCHRRGVHAMGGMAAQIPIKNDEARNKTALDKVRADKLREVSDGHDGTWVAHPGLVPVAREVFEARMNGKNQLERLREDFTASAADLLQVPKGTRTEEGLRLNVRVGIQYIESWLRGLGCVPLYYLMEDAATAEISRAQVWQWLHHGAALEDGRPVTPELIGAIIDDEMKRIEGEIGAPRFEKGRFAEARALFERISTAPSLETFL